MKAGKQPESATDKQWRLKQIRNQMNEFEQWFHPAPDEVSHLLYLAREWAALADLGLSEKDFASNKQYQRACKDSMFPRLIRFCKDNLDGIARYCESRCLSGKGTLRDVDIQAIKELYLTVDLESVEVLCLRLEDVDIAGMLARILRTCYRALKNPSTLDDLSISELRGDLLDVIARTYADINTVLREQALHGLNSGLAQVKGVVGAKKARADAISGKGVNMDEVKKRFLELKKSNYNWGLSAIATQLCKDFPKLKYHTVRKSEWQKKLTAP